jgi:hypothetical protein
MIVQFEFYSTPVRCQIHYVFKVSYQHYDINKTHYIFSLPNGAEFNHGRSKGYLLS